MRLKEVALAQWLKQSKLLAPASVETDGMQSLEGDSINLTRQHRIKVWKQPCSPANAGEGSDATILSSPRQDMAPTALQDRTDGHLKRSLTCRFTILGTYGYSP